MSDSTKRNKKSLDKTYPAGYNVDAIEVRETDVFKKWMKSLKDRTARSIINERIRRLSLGNKGDSEPVGAGVSELRIDYGPGYRIYYIQVREKIIVLLCGGDKSSQIRDIAKAKQLASNVEVAD